MWMKNCLKQTQTDSTHTHTHTHTTHTYTRKMDSKRLHACSQFPSHSHAAASCCSSNSSKRKSNCGLEHLLKLGLHHSDSQLQFRALAHSQQTRKILKWLHPLDTAFTSLQHNFEHLFGSSELQRCCIKLNRWYFGLFRFTCSTESC